jgi:hypothetical protein
LLSVNNGQFLISDTITRVFGVEMEIFSDDFEEMPYWISDQWGVTEDESHSPSRSMTDSPVGPYQNDANSAIILDTVIDLRGVNAAFLRFWGRWEIEAGYDYVQVFAADSADGTWTALTGKYTRPGTEYQAEGEPVYDGLQTQWVEEEINLSAWAESQIRIKFNLVSDHYQREDGFYFDDLSVSVVSTTTGTAEKYSIDFPVALSLYPNPANGIVNVDYQSAEIERLQLTLYSICGKLMRVVHLDNHKGSVTLSVGELTPGFYYVGLQTGNRILTAKKLVVR